MTEYEKESYAFVEDVLFENFLKLARVNLLTGEYEFIKIDRNLQDVEHEKISSIYSYIEKQVTQRLVLSQYARDYLKFSNPQYVQNRVFGGERKIIQSYTRKSKDSYIWVTFGIIAPENCSPENPWAVFYWREADTDTTTMVDALSTLSFIYYKILKINLTTDTYTVVKTDEQERERFVNRLNKISDWWREFEQSGNVFRDDVSQYREFTDLDRLRKRCREKAETQSCRYRRKIGDDYRWVQMDLVPSIEYSCDNQVLILYVKDIHEEYLREQHSRQQLIDNFYRDALTLLYNRHKYNQDLEAFRKSAPEKFTCLYVDVNGLHELNNHLGHEKGDDMLCSVADALRKHFSDDLVYRIGGDEFVVLSTTLSKKSVEKVLTEIRKDLEEDHYEISAGVESGREGYSPYRVVGAAELAMRQDKERYYRENHHHSKKRVLNEELEKMLTEKQDADNFLKVIESRFAGVYYVDLNTDSSRHLYIPEYFLKLLEGTDFSYSAALRQYVNRFVKEEYHPLFFKVLDYDYLAKTLRENGGLRFSYEKVNGTKVILQILPAKNASQEKPETLWIYSRESEMEF